MIATTPRLTSGVAMTASSAAITRSQFSSISVPPPCAPPFTAAIIGFEEHCLREMDPKPFTCSSASLHSLSGVFSEWARVFHLNTKQCQAMGMCQATLGTYASKSAPAQNARPSPVTMTTLYNATSFRAPSAHMNHEFDVPQARFVIKPVQNSGNVCIHSGCHCVQRPRSVQCEEHDMFCGEGDLDLLRMLRDLILHCSEKAKVRACGRCGLPREPVKVYWDTYASSRRGRLRKTPGDRGYGL